MAGKSNKTTAVGIRVPNDLLAKWREGVGVGGSISAYILERVQRGSSSPSVAAAVPVCDRQPEIAGSVDLKEGESAVTLVVPTSLLDRMPAGDRIAMMEDALILRYGNGVIKRIR